MAKESAMMKQFRDLKSKHPDAVLLFRCGDFYEAYEGDAKACTEILGITLTVNNKTGVKLAGFPHHAIDTYLPRLIRAGKRVAICDQLEDPKLTKRLKERGITENIQDTQNEKTMESKVKAADLIGKIIVNKEGTLKYRVINADDGDKLQVEFIRGDSSVAVMAMPAQQVEKLLAGGWTIAGEEPAKQTAEPVEDVAEPKKRKVSIKKKTEPKTEPKTAAGKYTFEEYKTAKGKTGAKILGVQETDAVYQQASSIHASGSYMRDVRGEKHCYLCFGPRYLDAARQVCEAMNAGKPIEELKAIVDAATEERHQKREEWKQKRAEHKAGSERLYTEQEVADLLRRVMADKPDKDAMAEVNRLMGAA